MQKKEAAALPKAAVLAVMCLCLLTLGILWSQLSVSIRFLLGLASLACFADLVFHRSFAAFLRWFGRTDEAVRLIETLIVTVSAIGSLVLGLLRAFGVI